MKNKTYIISSILSILLMIIAFAVWHFYPNHVTKGIGTFAIFAAFLFIFFGIVYVDEGKEESK